MNILLVTNNLYPTGGDWTYVNSVAQLYKSQGHNVFLFGQKNERNIDKTYESYYVSGVTEANKKSLLWLLFKGVWRSVYSVESYKKIGVFLDKFNIDIVQLNSIHIGLTPSIINAINERKIPIVWRILDYKPICPSIYLRCGNEICEACKGGRYWNCIKKKCKNDSLLDSTAVALESFFYSKRKEYSKVNMFSFQNEFMRRRYIEWGVDENKTIAINNPYDVSLIEPGNTIGDYVLYFGRLDKPKGVLTLIETAKVNKDIKYVIVGKGDEEDSIQNEINNCGLSNVDYKGPIWGDEMERIIENARIVVVPSEWYEPSPYVVLQSFAHAKPVIASNLGGLPDMISDGEEGVLFEAGNINDLANKISTLYLNLEKIKVMGEKARKRVETNYSPEIYYKNTMAMFNKLISNKG